MRFIGESNPQQTTPMKISSIQHRWERWEQGKIGYALLWLLGIPLPVLLIFYLLRGGN